MARSLKYDYPNPKAPQLVRITGNLSEMFIVLCFSMQAGSGRPFHGNA
jgi:hypothetical protein